MSNRKIFLVFAVLLEPTRRAFAHSFPSAAR